MIIKSEKELQLLNNIERPFLYPVLLDERHHLALNSIIAIIVIDLDTKNWYAIGNGHPDCLYKTTNLSQLNQNFIWVYDKLAFKYASLDTDRYYDVVSNYYLKTNQTTFENVNMLHNFYATKYTECLKINELIPIQKHVEYAWEVAKTYTCDKQDGLDFYNNTILQVLHKVERNGLRVTNDFGTVFGETKVKDYAYTKYNPYTTTGRPSNRFGNINYAALNKENSSRECFISRFEEGNLLEIDFESYHPRLLASIVGYDFGEVNVYKHLAEHYFKTNNPTKEQIKDSKELTFRQLYGGVQAQYKNIPFFAKVNDFANTLYKLYLDNGYIVSPISGRRLKGCFEGLDVVTKNILLNYFVQMYETEFNMLMLRDVFNSLPSTSLPILYTYDSVLFDTKLPNEIVSNLQSVVDVAKFPFKIKIGQTYKDLVITKLENYLLEKSL